MPRSWPSRRPLGAAPLTVKGEVVDLACYKNDKAKMGEAHKGCGMTCVKKGNPLAIVTPDGQVYNLAGAYTENKNAKIVEGELFAVRSRPRARWRRRTARRSLPSRR